ncbi:glycosyltransferase family 2 protein [Parasedimentitalea marina]|uniref:Glycosyltransferase family 2 protein n=1 Tax=Parasedimentitalea marina TaxID=2483033 RepID=A0A3T0N5P3_9RHOB|nr:glycosyltransferase family A protein [Parasedimentitalea marina]AZV79334.1 glycosyltransferase family 2 protein [Parasedimentitalea marina]
MNNMPDQPFVSIVAPMYNLDSFIAETIQSVLSQTYTNFELILVDDCSSDETLARVQSFRDSRIKLILNEENKGAGETRNVGIRAARGNLIAFLDADDLWYPNKLMSQLAFMDRTGSAVCYTLYDVINAQGVVYADCGYVPKKATYHQILRRNFIRTSSLIFNVDKVGGKVYFPKIRKRQDMLLFLDLIKRVGQANLLDEVTCSYRLHSGGISANKKSVIPYQWAAYRHEEKLSLPYSAVLMSAWFVLAGYATLRRRMKMDRQYNNS